MHNIFYYENNDGSYAIFSNCRPGVCLGHIKRDLIMGQYFTPLNNRIPIYSYELADILKLIIDISGIGGSVYLGMPKAPTDQYEF